MAIIRPFKRLLSRGKPAFLVSVEPLPEALVERLKRAAPLIDSRLGKMKNIDPRAFMEITRDGRPKTRPKESTEKWGRRVREMNVVRNFPQQKLAIKRAHSGTALECINTVASKVREFNKKRIWLRGCILLEPIAYPISESLIAMPKIDAPAVSEIIKDRDKTERGRKFFKKLKENFHISEKMLKRVAKRTYKKSLIDIENMLLLGFKKGKFVFMAMPDVF